MRGPTSEVVSARFYAGESAPNRASLTERDCDLINEDDEGFSGTYQFKPLQINKKRLNKYIKKYVSCSPVFPSKKNLLCGRRINQSIVRSPV